MYLTIVTGLILILYLTHLGEEEGKVGNHQELEVEVEVGVEV
jgi:hypothetical protein